MDLKKEKFDVIIQAGQSNAEGNGLGEAEKLVLSDDIFWLEAKKRVSIVDDETYGENLLIEYDNEPFSIVQAQEYIDKNRLAANFSMTFSDLYEKKYLEKDRKLLVIRAAVGGSGFKKGQWGIGKQLYLKMLDMIAYALSLNAENRLVAFLWHQGEHDAYEKNPPEVLEKQLSDMLADLRAKSGDIPFIAADFCHDWTDRHTDVIKPISDAVKKVFLGAGGAFVSSEGLTSNDQETMNSDIIHFSRKAQYELGKRYFEAFAKSVK